MMHHDRAPLRRRWLATLIVSGGALLGCGTTTPTTTAAPATLAPAPPATDDVPAVHAQAPLGPAGSSPTAQSAFHQYDTMQQTLYQHKRAVDVATGHYFYDCVGFVTWTLDNNAPTAAQAMRTATGVTSMARVPAPPRYQSFFADLPAHPANGWQAVTAVADVRAGDVLAWPNEPNNTDENGHAVLAAGVPVKQSDGTWALAVLDSTATPHGPDDTRRSNPDNLPGPNGKPSGLGIGTIGLVVDPNGAPSGVQWSLGVKTTQVPISIGRPTA